MCWSILRLDARQLRQTATSANGTKAVRRSPRPVGARDIFSGTKERASRTSDADVVTQSVCGACGDNKPASTGTILGLPAQQRHKHTPIYAAIPRPVTPTGHDVRRTGSGRRVNQAEWMMQSLNSVLDLSIRQTGDVLCHLPLQPPSSAFVMLQHHGCESAPIIQPPSPHSHPRLSTPSGGCQGSSAGRKMPRVHAPQPHCPTFPSNCFSACPYREARPPQFSARLKSSCLHIVVAF